MLKNIIKKIIPPIFFDIINYLSDYANKKNSQKNKNYFSGDFLTWEDAIKSSTGYDSPEILEKVRASLMKVKKGEAIYERDSILFEKVEYAWPLLANLLLIASVNKNYLNIIDFGGSLGTTYYQNIVYLKHLEYLKWNIVEQKHFVDCGKEYFEDLNLRFYYSIEECLAVEKPDVIILSGVLMYLQNPYELLKKIVNYNFQWVLIDRTYISNKDRDILKIQNVFPPYYKASYPMWFLNERKILSCFDKKYELISDFEGFSTGEASKGFFFKLKNI